MDDSSLSLSVFISPFKLQDSGMQEQCLLCNVYIAHNPMVAAEKYFFTV